MTFPGIPDGWSPCYFNPRCTPNFYVNFKCAPKSGRFRFSFILRSGMLFSQSLLVLQKKGYSETHTPSNFIHVAVKICTGTVQMRPLKLTLKSHSRWKFRPYLDLDLERMPAFYIQGPKKMPHFVARKFWSLKKSYFEIQNNCFRWKSSYFHWKNIIRSENQLKLQFCISIYTFRGK